MKYESLVVGYGVLNTGTLLISAKSINSLGGLLLLVMMIHGTLKVKYFFKAFTLSTFES